MARPEKFPIKFQLGIDQNMKDKIIEWRRKQEDLPNYNQAIRRLIELGLKSNQIKGEQNEDT